jgi:DNA-binding CsgD family transcriptional regulator
MSQRAEPLVRTQALAKLAELHLVQGRIDEATRLIEGIKDHPASTFVRACICIARGELDVAAPILRRRLRDLGDSCVDSAPLLELLVEVEIEQGDTAGATSRAQRLVAVGECSSCDIILARGKRALGRALTARARSTEAATHLECAYKLFARLELPFEAAQASLLLARALGGSDREAAAAEAQAALTSFQGLGAARHADAAVAYLRTVGVKTTRGTPKGSGGLTRREMEVLELLAEGLSNRELAARLCITRKTVENHVASVLSKLELNSRAGAAAYAVRQATRNSTSN